MLLDGNHGQKPFQNLPDVSGHGSVHHHVFIDLRRVHIDLEDLCLVGEMFGISYVPVGESGPQHNNQVALVHAQIGGFGSVHAQHAGVQLVGAREGSLAHQAVADRGLNLFRQFPHLRGSSGSGGPASHKQEGLFGRGDHCRRPVQILLADQICHRRNFLRLLRCVFTYIRGYILGYIHQHRARPAGSGDLKCLADGFCQNIHILDNDAVFGHRHGDAGDIHLLETVLAQKGGPHVGRNSHYRNGIHIGGGNAGDQIGGAGAAGGKAHAHFSRSSGITVRRMGRALLVGGEDVPDLRVSV